MENAVVQLLRHGVVLRNLRGADAVDRRRHAALWRVLVRVADNLQFLRLEEVGAVPDLYFARSAAVTSKVLHCGCIL